MTLDVAQERKSSKRLGKIDFANRRYSNPDGGDPVLEDPNIVLANRPNTSKNNVEVVPGNSLSKSFNKKVLGLNN